MSRAQGLSSDRSMKLGIKKCLGRNKVITPAYVATYVSDRLPVTKEQMECISSHFAPSSAISSGAWRVTPLPAR